MSDRNFAPGSLYGGIDFKADEKDAAPSEADAKKSNWSSALAFAPTRRPQAQKAKPRPPPAFSFNTAQSSSTDQTNPSASSIVRSAAPILNITPSSSNASPSTSAPPASSFADTRTLPSLTLDESSSSYPNKRLAPSSTTDQSAEFAASHKKSKRRKKAAASGNQPHQPAFDPHEMYDPSKPNDLGEYKRWRDGERKRKEEARRAKREREREVERRGEKGYESEGSYYSEDEESEEERSGAGIGNKGFAPPPSLSAPSNPYPVFHPSAAPYGQPPPSVPVAAPPRAETGEEAYLRRAGLLPPASAPTFTPSVPTSAPPTGPSPPSASEFSASPAFPSPVAFPSSSTPLDPTSQPFVPSSSSAEPSTPTPPLPASTPATTPLSPASFQKKLADARASAAAIAARFKPPPSFGGAIAPGVTPKVAAANDGSGDKKQEEAQGEPKEKDTRDFAVRMMEKWGHKEGTGLGVDASGITTPLLVSKPPPPPKKNHPSYSSSSQQSGIATQSTLMTSEHSSRRAAADLAQYGASSRIVLLQGMVGSLAELDGGEEDEGELASDVAEECSKHGVVVRVVIHRVGENSRLFREEVMGAERDASKAVRIFVVFSGVAGAWTAMKALDGRFFGGRTVRARYFDEGMFERGQRDE